jgi:hypothetical protein
MEEGFRSAETTLPFKVLATLQDVPVDLVRMKRTEPTPKRSLRH